jgi:hypothetical protein
MAAHTGRKQFGLFDNGCFQKRTNTNFEVYNIYTQDAISNSVCGVVDYNTYGSGFYSNYRVPIDPSKSYQFAVSVRTIQRSYNDRLGSGHLGIRMWDKDNNLLRYGTIQNSSSAPTSQLTREAFPGDTVLYINEPWSGTHSQSWVSFYPASHPDYSTPYYTTQFSVQYDDTSYTDIGGGEYTVTLNSGLPNWGYALPAETPILQRLGYVNPNIYNLGAPNYPETWTTYITTVVSGENFDGGFFRNGTRYVSFLNLRNYNFRNETDGNSARYLIDNILCVECPNGVAWPNELFKRSSVR